MKFEIVPVDILAGDQFSPEFLAISPNNRIPAIIDTDPADGNAELPMFESGAILLYLADKADRFTPREPRARAEMMQWLFWQVSGLGPMAGQNHYFNRFALEKAPLAIERYLKETARLYHVLDTRLADRRHVAGDDYGLADMACHPWIKLHKLQSQDLADYPNLRRWYEEVLQRPAVGRAYARDRQMRAARQAGNEERSLFFHTTRSEYQAAVRREADQ
ncbi:thiol:disulfide oxidoreductase [Novosphingobium indicum]|uniref:Thiol:disulfide oxidoreductase n=2 Tax=Novosphingobium indicum TaxID=462949 RepID=A0ABQ2K411_9SPHN|nr:thiol:disulfide oxidoreductase [Novosphingobium indicum]